MVGVVVVAAIGLTALAISVGNRPAGSVGGGSDGVGLAADLDAATAAGLPAYVLIHSDG